MPRILPTITAFATACLLFALLPMSASAAQVTPLPPPLSPEGPPAAPPGPQAADLPAPVEFDAGDARYDSTPDRFEIDLFDNKAVVRVNSLTVFVGTAPHIELNARSDATVDIVITAASDAPETLISLSSFNRRGDSLNLTGDTGDVTFTPTRTRGDIVARNGTLRIVNASNARISTTTPNARLTVDSTTYEPANSITIQDNDVAADGFSRVTASSEERFYCPVGYDQNGTGALTTCSRPGPQPMEQAAIIVGTDSDGQPTYTCPAGYASSGSGPAKTCTRSVASVDPPGPSYVPESFDWLTFAGFRTAWAWSGVGSEDLRYESLDTKSTLRELHLMGTDTDRDAETGTWGLGSDRSNDTISVAGSAPALDLVTAGGWYGGDIVRVDAAYSGPVWLFGGSAEFWADDAYRAYLNFTDDGRNWLFGGSGSDYFVGGDNKDYMQGGSGNDVMEGLLGIDRMWGGPGADSMYGGGGSDRMYGDDGGDQIAAGSGADQVYGGPGADTINGQGGQDVIYGDAGNDTLQGNHQSDMIYGGEGDDFLGGAKGKDTLWGDEGNDTLSGGENSDQLDGGLGADDLRGGRGADTCTADATDTSSSCRRS